jgi:hypothetical protein
VKRLYFIQTWICKWNIDRHHWKKQSSKLSTAPDSTVILGSGPRRTHGQYILLSLTLLSHYSDYP